MHLSDKVINAIRDLPPSKMVELIRSIDRLDPEGARRRREERNRLLEETAGSMAGVEGEAFEQAALKGRNGNLDRESGLGVETS